MKAAGISHTQDAGIFAHAAQVLPEALVAVGLAEYADAPPADAPPAKPRRERKQAQAAPPQERPDSFASFTDWLAGDRSRPWVKPDAGTQVSVRDIRRHLYAQHGAVLTARSASTGLVYTLADGTSVAVYKAAWTPKDTGVMVKRA